MDKHFISEVFSSVCVLQKTLQTTFVFLCVNTKKKRKLRKIIFFEFIEMKNHALLSWLDFQFCMMYLAFVTCFEKKNMSAVTSVKYIIKLVVSSLALQ